MAEPKASLEKEATVRQQSEGSSAAVSAIDSPRPEPLTTEELPAKDVAATKNDDQEDEWLEGPKLWAVMGPLVLVFFLVLLDTTIISTAIPKITNQFNSLPDIGWYTAAYQLASSVLQPLAGKLYVNFR